MCGATHTCGKWSIRVHAEEVLFGWAKVNITIMETLFMGKTKALRHRPLTLMLLHSIKVCGYVILMWEKHLHITYLCVKSSWLRTKQIKIEVDMGSNLTILNIRIVYHSNNHKVPNVIFLYILWNTKDTYYIGMSNN